MDETDSSSNNDDFFEADTIRSIEDVQEWNEEDVETQSDGGSDDIDCLSGDDVETQSNGVSDEIGCLSEGDVEESLSDEEPEFNVVESPGGKTKHVPITDE
ncbi:hypothetical protein L2E82_45127 [Cichorium intybus]|uniref:Uncharacterized protein n=1 Tax=Cichorium intybus TaxID=13427 RepID=A0ACB8ZSG0_CICIN|nr:hypothetical protein L2E82_45127 [Cichorium intybus]